MMKGCNTERPARRKTSNLTCESCESANLWTRWASDPRHLDWFNGRNLECKGYHAITNSSMKKQITWSYEPRCSPNLHPCSSWSLAPASQWWLRPGYHVAIHPRKHQKCRSTTSASESKCGEVVNRLLTFTSKATSVPVCDVWKKWWTYRGPKKKHCWTTAKMDSKKRSKQNGESDICWS